MSEPVDNETAYGADQDREAPKTTEPGGPDADRNPDDFGPEVLDGTDINPATGIEYGAVDGGRHDA